jgi:pimeloyl-ACP methyl ester carboxylesterase
MDDQQIVPKLLPHVSVFVPEVGSHSSLRIIPAPVPSTQYIHPSIHKIPLQLPGYGISTTTTAPLTKRNMGLSILSALSAVFALPSTTKTPLILLSHDRGARISHRLAVDFAHPTADTSPLLSNFDLKGFILMDILPTTVQWAAFSSPGASAGYFHWPFLARPDIAVPMITAYGGDRFCNDLLVKGSGDNEEGRASFFAGDSAEVYTRNFKTQEAIKGACEDYADGGGAEVELQKRDQEGGRKIGVSTLVLWSKRGIGRWGDAGAIWGKDWVREGTEVSGHAIEGGIGHYLAEEAPSVVWGQVGGWLGGLGVKGFEQGGL